MESLIEARLKKRLGFAVTLMQLGLHAHRQNKILLFGFRQGHSEPSIVCRLSRSQMGSELMRQEALTRYLAYERLDPLDKAALPWLVVEELPFGTCLIEPFVTGTPLRIPERPEALEALGRMTLGWARALRRATTHRNALPEVLCEAAERTLDRAASGFESREIRALAERLRPGVRSLHGLFPSAVHGDFWHGNLKVSSGQLKVLDWEYAQIQGNPLFDPALNLVALSGALPGSALEGFEACFLRPSEHARAMGRLLEAHAGEGASQEAMATTVLLVAVELVLRNLATTADIRRDRHYPLLERLAAEPDPQAAVSAALWSKR